MDPVLAEVYSTVMPLAPYVIGAFLLIWILLLAFVIVMLMRVKKTDADIKALQESIEKLNKKAEKIKADKD